MSAKPTPIESMKLAFCLLNYFPYGGLERNFLRIAKECIARGHAVEVLTMQWEGTKPDGLTIIELPRRGMSNHRQAACFSEAAVRHLQRSPYDLVIGFHRMPGLDLYYAADVCYAARIARQRGFISRLTPRYRTFAALERAVFAPGSSTEILMLSEKEKTIYQATYNTQEARFHLVPPGVDKKRIRACANRESREKIRAELGIAPQETVLMMIGSHFDTKGVDRSILALAALPRRKRQTASLWVIGKGNEKNYVKLARRNNIADHVHFLGTREDVPLLLAGADYLLQPSRNENTGNAIVEALVAGVPVMATDNCGYAVHVSRSGAGVVIPGAPFSQQRMNEELAEMLISRREGDWRQQAIEYGDSTDLYHRFQVIVDTIERLGRQKKKRPNAAHAARHDWTTPIPLESHGGRALAGLVVNAQFAPLLRQLDLADFTSIWEYESGELIKQKGERSVLRVAIPAAAHAAPHAPATREAVVVYIKKHRERLSPWRFLRALLQPAWLRGEGPGEFANYCRFRAQGLGTAVPVAAGSRLTSLFRLDSFLITRDFSPLASLEEIVLQQPASLQGEENRPHRRAMLRAIASYARRMHDSGFNQKDFNATHILLDDSTQPAPQIALFDLQRVDRNRLNRYRWPIKAMAELNFTLPSGLFDDDDRLFLYSSYLGKEWFSHLDSLLFFLIRRKTAKIARHTEKRGLAPKRNMHA